MSASHRPPDPVDVRWVPALLTCLLLGQATPGWPSNVSAAVSTVCAATAVAGLAVLGVSSRGRRGRGLFTALVLAGLAGALLVQHVTLERSSREGAGWVEVVSAEQAVRVELEPRGPAAARDSRFGPSWTRPVVVSAFGHPTRPLQPSVEATLSGSGQPPSATADAARMCAVAVPREEGGSLFLTAKAAPVPGTCPGGERHTAGGAQHGGDGTGERTGRDRLREGFRSAAADGVGGSPELIPGLVLGDRTAQSEQTEQEMKDSGLSHLSAVSGANCALLLGAVTLALRSLRIHRGVVVAAGLATLVVFVLVVGPEPSVLRAAVMGALGALAVFLGRGRQAFSLLGAGGTLLLVAVPSLAGEVAFHLSLAATAGIVLVAAPADRWLHTALSRLLPDTVARWLSSALAVTTAAHLACQPILLAMTGTVSTWAIPANLAAAPAVAPVTVVGTLAAALVVPLPALADALVWVVQWPSAWIGLVAHLAATAPGAVRPWPSGTLGLVLGVLLTVATLAGFRAVLVLERSVPAPVRRVGASAPAARRRLPADAVLAAVLGAAALGVGAAVVVPRPAGAVPEGWAVAFCDVGQGDMSVFRSGEHSAVVVDTGPEPERAERCLDDLAVDRVDALLITHLHADHAGGLSAFTGSRAPVVVRYGAWSGSGTSAGEESGTAPPPGAAPLSAGEAGHAGALRWTVLLADPAAAEQNDSSAQLLVSVEGPGGPVTTLVTGDLEQEASAAWAAGLRSDAAPPSAVDVLKVAHHGARNGGLAVPEAVHARLQVISVGADNDYGHPHPATVAGLERLGPVLRTDRLGTFALVPAADGSLQTTTVRLPEISGG